MLHKFDLTILMVEDNIGDQYLLTEILNDLGVAKVCAASSYASAVELISKENIDIILLDLSLPDSTGIETFHKINKIAGNTAIVILSGLADMQLALEAINQGAQDYLIKADYDDKLLAKTIVYSIERKNNLQALQESNERYRHLFNNNPASILVVDLKDLQILELNDTALKQYGYSREEFLELTALNLVAPGEHEKFKELISKATTQTDLQTVGTWKHVNKKGDTIFMNYVSQRIIYKGKPVIMSLGNDVTEKVLLEQKLETEQSKKQKEITDAVIIAQEKERERIGGELHDNVNQILASSLIYLRLAKNDANAGQNFYAETTAMINSAINEIRKLSHSILPPSLNDTKLTDALEWMIETTERTGTITVEKEISGIDEKSLSGKLKLTIYRIVQEQFNNILKYAKAKHISIKLLQEDERILLSIKDDGMGFDPTVKSKGVGLMNIKTRASLHNGELKIISSPGNGCQMLLTFDNVNEMSVQD